MRCVFLFVDFREEAQGDRNHRGMELRQMHLPACAMCNANRNDEDKDGNAMGAYSSSSSARSATTTVLKREWPLADEKDYATKK